MEAIPPPVQVTIELTTACNLRCRHCAVSTAGYSARTMKRELLHSVIEQLAALDPQPAKVQLSGHGESTALPWFEETITLLRSRLPATLIGLHTNGTLLERHARVLAESSPVVLALSVDGVGPVFDEIRGAGSFERMVRGLTAVVGMKQRLGTVSPILSFVTVLSTRTVFELPKVVCLAAQFRVKEIVVQPLTPYRELSTEQWELAALPPDERHYAEATLLRARVTAHELGVALHFVGGEPFAQVGTEWHYYPESGAQPAAAGERPQPFFRHCLDPWHTAFVNVDGRFNTCSHRHHDATESLEERSFAEIWYHSAGLNKVRDNLLQGRLDGACVSCPYREAADYPLVPPPRWVNK